MIKSLHSELFKFNQNKNKNFMLMKKSRSVVFLVFGNAFDYDTSRKSPWESQPFNTYQRLLSANTAGLLFQNHDEIWHHSALKGKELLSRLWNENIMTCESHKTSLFIHLKVQTSWIFHLSQLCFFWLNSKLLIFEIMTHGEGKNAVFQLC